MQDASCISAQAPARQTQSHIERAMVSGVANKFSIQVSWENCCGAGLLEIGRGRRYICEARCDSQAMAKGGSIVFAYNSSVFNVALKIYMHIYLNKRPEVSSRS